LHLGLLNAKFFKKFLGILRHFTFERCIFSKQFASFRGAPPVRRRGVFLNIKECKTL
jgi:hypothetical protein